MEITISQEALIGIVGIIMTIIGAAYKVGYDIGSNKSARK